MEPADVYRWLTPSSMFQRRDPASYLRVYAEDWRTLLRKYGDEQLTIIYDWLFKRIKSLSWGQYIVIEKDAISLANNLWLKGKFSQWNVPDHDRINQFRWIAYLLIEWIWQNNCVAIWSISTATVTNASPSGSATVPAASPSAPVQDGSAANSSFLIPHSSFPPSETRLTIVEPSTDRRRAIYSDFGHWPLSQPPAPFGLLDS